LPPRSLRDAAVGKECGKRSHANENDGRNAVLVLGPKPRSLSRGAFSENAIAHADEAVTGGVSAYSCLGITFPAASAVKASGASTIAIS
jgi:hypothetical protein